MKRLGLLFLLLMVWMVPAVPAVAEPLTFSYFERPPYYFTNSAGKADGFLVDRAREILNEAKLEANFITLTPYRIMYVLPRATLPHCSIGWFKSSERERFAKFSLPIYRNQALVLLTSQGQKDRFSSFKTLREVFSDPRLTMVRMAEFSYGDFVDNLLAELSPQSNFLTGKQADLLKVVLQKEASYMLVAPEEVATMAEYAGVPSVKLKRFQLADVPSGNLRYLMCSQAVPEETMDQVNKALIKLYRKWGSENCQ